MEQNIKHLKCEQQYHLLSNNSIFKCGRPFQGGGANLSTTVHVCVRSLYGVGCEPDEGPGKILHSGCFVMQSSASFEGDIRQCPPLETILVSFDMPLMWTVSSEFYGD